MKEIYSPSLGAKIIASVIALIPTLIGLLLLYGASQEHFSIMLIASAILFFILAAFIIDNGFTKIILDADTLTFKPLFRKNKQYNLKDLAEIAWFVLPQKGKSAILGGTPEATGRAIGNGLLAIAASSAKNSIKGYQLLLKEKSGKHYSIKTNFINNSNQLVDNIKKRSGLQSTTILASEYRAWIRGELDFYRQDPDRSKRQLLNRLFKVRYLLYLPIVAFVVFFLALQIGFHWAEYQYVKTVERPFAEDFITEKESPIKSREYSDEIDIFLKGETQPILKKIVVEEGWCDKENKKFDNELHYYNFPFQHPYCFNHLLNLDSDSEPEIIFRYDSDYGLPYRVYDFSASMQTFIEKPISSFSVVLELYINSVTGMGVGWKYIWDMAVIFLVGYLVVAGLILFAFYRVKKSLRKLSSNTY